MTPQDPLPSSQASSAPGKPSFVFVPATSDTCDIINSPSAPDDRRVHFIILTAVVFCGLAFAYLNFTLLDSNLNERLAKIGGTAGPIQQVMPPIADRPESADGVSFKPGRATANKFWSMPSQAESLPTLLSPRQLAPGPRGILERAAKSVD